jgi:rhodanese-related sulfurtransferase
MTSDMEDPDALEVEPQRVRQMLETGEDCLLLDCRTPEEHAAARIDGAMLVPMQEMSLQIGRLREHEERRIVVFCHHGRRSLSVTIALRQLGFEKVQSMAGGIHRWSAEIDPSVPQYTK